ncbi:hypothetical protein HMPREF9347_05157 [Escherichia coli MS 124-1]|nr:hypothetical protein HMPREF9541_02410 [Escherichia coli MS 116-1]EFK65969.1 hypothetical protein HMPREF9347_05157 [Escherichia coli MS 124-1]ESE29289.1 hypothetical protein HMPREF1622_04193 [Escherichia coli A35218R]
MYEKKQGISKGRSSASGDRWSVVKVAVKACYRNVLSSLEYDTPPRNHHLNL